MFSPLSSAWKALSTLAAPLLGAALLGACADEVSDVAPIARVGSWQLTAAEFESEVAAKLAAGRRDTRELRRELLDARIEQAVLLESARTTGFLEDPELRAEIDELVAQRFRETRIEAELRRTDVSRSEVAAHYSADPLRYTEPERVRVAAILVDVPRKASAAQRAAARARADEALERARDQLASGEGRDGFGRLAARFSQDAASRYAGGDLGWLTAGAERGGWGPALFEAARHLTERGQLSAVVETPVGFAIAKRLGHQPERMRPLEEVEDRIRRRLLAEKREALRTSVWTELRSDLEIEIDEEAVAALGPATEPTRVARPAPRPPALPGGL